MTRRPFSLSRLVKVADTGHVVYKAEKQACRAFPDPRANGPASGPKRDFQILDPSDFLGEFAQHIPPEGARSVRYFGFYSNKSRGMRKKAAGEPAEKASKPSDGDDAFAPPPARGSPTRSLRTASRSRSTGGRFVNRPLTFRGDQCRVRLQKGDVFRIRIANRSGRDVFVCALVDGPNTLPERSQEKGAYVEARKGPYRQAQPVNLVEARAWLAPAGVANVIEGFFLKTGENAEYDAFKVSDAAQSFAGRLGYTDQLGLITVAFFERQKKPHLPPRGARAHGELGVGPGGRCKTPTEGYDDYIPGRTLAVVHIRYGQ